MGLAKEHHAAADLETRISGVLRTFVNNMHATQSALFFDMVNYTPPPPYESAIQTRQVVNLPKIQPMENPFKYPGPVVRLESSQPPKPETKTVKVNTLDKYLKIETVNPEPQSTVSLESSPESHRQDRYDHIVQDYSQCCARVGSVEYYVEIESPEFLDNYPHGTYQTMDGYVIGDPCMRMVHNDLFDSGSVFCKRHNKGFEDIRNPPGSSHSHDPSADDLDIIFENDWPRPNYDLPLTDYDIDLL